MSAAGDDNTQRPRFPPPPGHFQNQHHYPQQHQFRPGGPVPVRVPGQVPPFIHQRLPNANVNGQPYPPGAPPLVHQPFQQSGLPHPQLPASHLLNNMQQQHHFRLPMSGGIHGHPQRPQQPLPTGVAYAAVHQQNMVFPPPTPRVRRESNSSGSSSPQSPSRPPLRDLPPIPGPDAATYSHNHSDELSKSASSSPSSSSRSTSSTSTEPASPLHTIQHRVMTLRDDGQSSSIAKAIDRGVAMAIEASATATVTTTVVNTGIAAATKALNSNQGQSLVHDAEKNPVLKELVQLADKLVDLGKVVPFIAPAFVILKMIIDVERQAREADAKCNDLLERISFLVSHLFVLEKIQEMDQSLKQVIERMHGVLKEAAALIEAYRKQSAIARRLKISNNQNFSDMASRVASVAEDLMFSLQIQQTGDLSVLKRSVPLDDQDREARQFVEKHGGQSAIENNPKLVEEFAKKMHLTMSDQVMEQMQTNLSDILEENQSKIETMLKETSRETVADMIKALAKEAREQAEEKLEICIQCEKTFRPSINGPEACSFHSSQSEYSGYSCCGKQAPCQVNYHRTDMHCDYPFPAFFEFARNIIGYTDTVEYWARLEEENLLTGDSQLAAVGRLLRWRTRHERIKTPKLLVRVGRLCTDAKYFFKVYSPEDLEEISNKLQKEGPQPTSRLIFKTSESETEFASAEWITDTEGKLMGIQLTVQVETYDTPTVCRVPLDLNTCEVPSGEEVTHVSKATFRLYKPATEYVLPETKQVGETLREDKLREARKFKAKIPNGVPLMMVPEGDLIANSRGRFVRPDADKMQGILTFYNRSPIASQEQIVLMSAKAEYRYVGEDEYREVDSFLLEDEIKFPLTIEAGRTLRVPYTAVISRGSKLKDLYMNIWGWALIALHRPIRVRVTFIDIEGREMSHVQEYVHKPRGLTMPKDEDLEFFYLDNLLAGSRTSVRISKPSDDTDVININGSNYNVGQLNKLVFRGLHEGKTEVEVQGREDNECHWKVYALIDRSCRRVYAFKVVMSQGPNFDKKTAGVVGYVRCPYYGEQGLEEREIKYAHEEAGLPELQDAEPIEIVVDDTVDDDTVPTSPSMPDAAVAAVSRPISPTSSRAASPTVAAAATVSMVAPAVSIATATSASVTAALQEVSKATAMAAPASHATGFDQAVFVSSMQSLERRLESLDTNVARMANALERLVEILKP